MIKSRGNLAYDLSLSLDRKWDITKISSKIDTDLILKMSEIYTGYYIKINSELYRKLYHKIFQWR